MYHIHISSDGGPTGPDTAGGGVDDRAAPVPQGLESGAESRGAPSEPGDEGENFTLKDREARRVIGELARLIPLWADTMRVVSLGGGPLPASIGLPPSPPPPLRGPVAVLPQASPDSPPRSSPGSAAVMPSEPTGPRSYQFEPLNLPRPDLLQRGEQAPPARSQTTAAEDGLKRTDDSRRAALGPDAGATAAAGPPGAQASEDSSKAEAVAGAAARHSTTAQEQFLATVAALANAQARTFQSAAACLRAIEQMPEATEAIISRIAAVQSRDRAQLEKLAAAVEAHARQISTLATTQ